MSVPDRFTAGAGLRRGSAAPVSPRWSGPLRIGAALCRALDWWTRCGDEFGSLGLRGVAYDPRAYYILGTPQDLPYYPMLRRMSERAAIRPSRSA